jgi:hypothetical protein
MTDVSFRISGGVTPEYTVEEMRESGIQVIPQGIGYQDVPVANVPSEELGEVLNPDTVAIGAFMQFMSQGWEEGKAHPRGSVVTNGIFSMVANKLTLAQPYPTPDGNPTFTLPAFTPTTQTDTSVIYSGHVWTFTESVLVKTLRIWVTQVTPDTNYRVVIVKSVLGSDPVTTVIEEPILTAGQWSNIAFLNDLVVAGTTLLVYIDGLNSGGSNEVTGGWTYNGQDNVSAPARGGWNQNNARTTLRIDKIDLDGTDRATELDGIIPDSVIVFADTDNPSAFDQYRTKSAPVDSGTYVEYEVVLQEQGEGGVPLGTTTMTADVPIAQPTEYAEELAGLADPAWATVAPFREFNGVDQTPAADTAFGVDLEAEITVFSEDWDILSLNA